MRNIIFVTILLAFFDQTFAQLKGKDTVRKIEIYFKTSNILSGNEQNKINELKRKINKIPSEAIDKYNQLQVAKNKLITDKIAETVTATICDEHTVWKIVKITLLGPVGAWVTERVCHDIQKANPVYVAATGNIQRLESELTSKAGQIGADALNQLSKEEEQLTNFKNNKIALEVTLSSIKPALNDQRLILAQLKEGLHQLEKYIREQLPLLNLDFIPNLNQWKLDNIAIIINGHDWKSYKVNKRFKQGSSSWMVTVGQSSEELRFLNELRVNPNKGNTGDGITAAATSPFFKEREISGWDDEPLYYGTVAGTPIEVIVLMKATGIRFIKT